METILLQNPVMLLLIYQLPQLTTALTISGGNVTLYASGADTLKWYDASTGGTLVNTGTSYTISLTYQMKHFMLKTM